VAASIINRMVSNTTMTFSNMVGPVEEVSFYGHPITYFASSAYGHPHVSCLFLSLFIKVDKMMIPQTSLFYFFLLLCLSNEM